MKTRRMAMDQKQFEVHENRYSQYRSVYHLFPGPGFIETVKTYLSQSLSHCGVFLLILKELFPDPKIEQKEGKTKEE